MELTCQQPATTSRSFLDIVFPTTSSVAMELTDSLNATIHPRKRPLEAEEDDLELPEELQPLAMSTPNVSSYTVPDMLVVYITT